MNPVESFVDLTTLAAGLVFLAELLFGKLFKLQGSVVKYLVIALGAAVGTAGAYVNLGMFAALDASAGHLALNYVHGPLVGALAGVLASGIFQSDKVKLVLQLLGLRAPLGSGTVVPVNLPQVVAVKPARVEPAPVVEPEAPVPAEHEEKAR